MKWATQSTAGMFGNRPAGETLALLRPVLEQDALAAESDALVRTLATLTLILEDELA